MVGFSNNWYRKKSYKILLLFQPVTWLYRNYFWSYLKNKFVTFTGITRYIKYINIPEDPRKSDEFVFLNNFKSSSDRTSHWMEKKQNFIRIFLMPIIWKSDHWSLHHALISKSGKNAENSRILLFSNLFRDLLSENVHIITKWVA